MSQYGENQEDVLDEAGDAQDHENENPNAGDDAGAAALSLSYAPWWGISILFHGLAIVLVSLVTMSIGTVSNQDTTVQAINIEKIPKLETVSQAPQTKLSTLISDRDTRATDPNSPIASNIEVDPTLNITLGDHFETINPDRPDTHSAFGNMDAHMYHNIRGDDSPAGGGGKDGLSFEETIGIGNLGSPGSGDGFGGGIGHGYGNDKGDGIGSFGRPDGAGRLAMALRHGGSHKTESRVESALAWLAKHQEVDGHWDCVKYGGKQADVATTGLALLAFLGAGHSEKVGIYKDNVKRAVYWLISIQNDDGKFYKQGETHGIGYHHAIAGLAMAEAAGMGNQAETIKSAQKGIDYTCQKHQQGENSDKLGFRYGPKEKGDLSVSGWFIMQLKSAKMAKLKVDQASLDGALKFIDSVEQKGAAGDAYGGNRFGYTSPGEAVRTSAIGCLCREFLGWKREEMKGGVEFFVQKGGMPQWDGNGGSVDLYYWYYGTLAVYQQDGPRGDLWNRWNAAMQKALVENQRKGGDEDGSWDPVGAYSEYWGRVGQTALGALCLEVYYRYNLMCK
ncbi:MAG: terpene cyclase/mutase family protein [Planctomycetes bacterium]|nr:terpene cyclase/mutase family protein [Planctomycetota bacterium]